jgi:PAS domain S-box-containing protein
MKIRQKVISGLLGTSLLIGFIGYISKMMHSDINQNASIVSETIKKEIKGAIEISLVLQETQISVHELLELKTYEVALKNIKNSQTINQAEQKNAESKIKGSLANFARQLQLNREATESGIQRFNNIGDPEALKELSEKLAEFNKIQLEFINYKNHIYKVLGLLEKSSIFKANNFEKIINKQYQEKLSSMVAKYRNEREKELLVQSAQVIKLINIANQQILILITVILITTILVYSLILGSILKFITYLTEAAYKIQQGKLDTRVNINSKDELGILASTFNQMMDYLNTTIISRFYIDNIITSMTDTLIVINSNTIITKINLATIMLLGYQEAELIGKPIKLILSQEENDKKLWIHESIEKGSITNIERSYLTKDNRKIPVSFSASVIRNDSGEMQGIVCVAQDIRDRKRAEETNLLLATAIEYAADAIEITDTEAKFEYVNPALKRLQDIHALKFWVRLLHLCFVATNMTRHFINRCQTLFRVAEFGVVLILGNAKMTRCTIKKPPFPLYVIRQVKSLTMLLLSEILLSAKN